jgi:hypothetical protein
MITGNISHPVNTLPFLSEEMERTLRLRAWKDEIFREALIADPKGVIQRLFPQCFPNGKLAEDLTIKVIEEDLDTCYIVVPFLPDEFPTLEIPEEEHLELLVNMGAADRLPRRTDSSDKRESQSSEKTKQPDLTRDSFKRRQAEENKENNPVSGDRPDSHESAKRPTDKQLKQAFTKLLQDKKNLPDILELYKKNPQEGVQKFLKDYLPDHKVPQGGDIKILQNTSDTHHIVLPKLPDTSLDTELPKYKQQSTESGEQTCKAVSC